MEQNQCGIGTGAIVIAFITGLAAGITAALLIESNKDISLGAEEHEDQLFI